MSQLIFYPKHGELISSSTKDKLDALLSAAEQYKALVLDPQKKEINADPAKRQTPREMSYSYNWDELAKLLREIRDFPENSSPNRLSKAENLVKLAEIYEVLRGAKMAKLEAVRLALVNEANQLRSTSAG